jgi:hypothetical protein
MLRPLADSAFRSQGYGLTETNSVAVGFGKPRILAPFQTSHHLVAGEDYDSRPASW